MKKIFIFLVAGIVLSACGAIMGEEVARIPVNKVSESESDLHIKEVSVDLKKGQKLAFWSEIDLESSGDLALEFRVRIFKGEEELEMLNVFPFKGNLTINESKVQVGDKLTWSFSKKNLEYTVPDDGNYTFAAILVSNGNEALKLNKAELVIRK